MVKKTMHHSVYMEDLKTHTAAELEYALGDARAALAAWPDGINAGFYADEVHYISMEMRKRDFPALFNGG